MENSVIATVVTVTGKAYARNADGELRELVAGDVLHEGETVVTPDGGRVDLSMVDGRVLTISDVPELALTRDLVAERAATREESAVEDETVEQVVAALESGQDLGEILPETAAGAGGAGGEGDEQHSFIRLGRIAENTSEFSGLLGSGAAASPEVVDVQEHIHAVDAVDDIAETEAGEPVRVPVAVNDDFVDGEIVISVTQPDNGTVIINGDNELIYTPDPGFVGEDTFTYTAVSPDGTGTDTATVTVVVLAQPTLSINDVEVVEGGVAELTVTLSETTDKTVTVQFDSEDGSATVVGGDYNAATGGITFAPGETSQTILVQTNTDNLQEGPEQFLVNLNSPTNATIADGEGVATIVDDFTPTLSIDDVTVSEGETAELTVTLSNAVDEVVTVTFDTTDDTATVLGGDYDPVTGTITFQPGQTSTTVLVQTNADNEQEGAEEFLVNLGSPTNATIADGQAVVTIVDDFTPTLSIDDVTVNEGAQAVVTVTLSAPVADTVTVDFATEDGSATVIGADYNPVSGGLTFAPGETTKTVIIQTNADDAQEGTESFTVELTSPVNAVIADDSGLVNIVDNFTPPPPVNLPPNAVNDNYSVDEDTQLTSNVLGNDSDPDGDNLVVTGNTNPANGTVTVDANGNFTYTPNSDFFGEDSFTYNITDGNGGTDTATVNITVNSVNDLPAAVGDSYTTAEDTPLVISAPGVLVNDSDPVEGDALSSVVVDGPSNGELTLNADGSFTYTPAADYYGPDSFTYVANDGSDDSNVATVNINVTPVNDTLPDTGSTKQDTPVEIDVMDNDNFEDVATLTGVDATTAQGGSAAIVNGVVVYTPDPDFVGTDTFQYTATDVHGNTENNTVTVFVSDEGVTLDTLGSTGLQVNESYLPAGTEAGAGSLTVPGSFALETPDGFGQLTIGTTVFGSIAAITDGTVIAMEHGQLVIDGAPVSTGVNAWTVNFNYTLDSSEDHDTDSGGFTNPGLDVLPMELQDFDGDIAPGQISINILNDAPVLAPDTETTIEGAVIGGNVLGNDLVGADELLNAVIGVESVNQSTVGAVDAPLAGQFGSLTLNASGTWEYTTNASVPTGSVDQFTYTVTDSDGNEDTTTLTITFEGDANLPTAGVTTATVDDDGVVPGGIGDNAAGDWVDTDLDGDSDESTYSGTLPHGFGLDGAGALDFAAMHNAAGTVGMENVSYDWDGTGNILTATVDGGSRDGTALFTVALNPATGAYTVALLANVLHAAGDVENDANAAVTYSVTDSDGSLVNGTLNITFDDDIPVAVDDGSVGLPIAVAEDTPLVIDVWSNDSAGADGVDLATGVVEASTSNPQKGSVTYNGDGTFTYTPNAGAEGADSFQYTVTDNDGDEVVVAATVYVDIGPDTVPITGTSAATVDDDGVAGGIGDNATGDWVDTNADLDNDESTFSGSLTAIFGGDIPGDVNFADMPATGTVGTENVAYAWVDGTSTLTATVDGGARDGLELFTVEVTDRLTGDYTVTLKANVMHETLDGLAGDNTENDASASLTYTATDIEGDSTPGTLNITFDDDIPVAVDDGSVGLPIAVAEDTPLVIDVWSNDSAGADGVDLATGVVEASTSNPQKGSVTYNGDGTFTYTPNAGAEGADSFQYTVTDNDGDEVVVAATVYVDIGPDTVPITGTSAATVDDDGVAGGIGDNATGDWVDTNADLDNDESTFSGSLTAIFGVDTPGDVNFADTPATGTVGTENVAYAWVDGTSTLTATVDGGARDGTVLFTVEVTDRQTGAYTVALLANVLHAPAGAENDALASLTYTATDSDGSSTPGTLNITFDDDIPVAVDDGSVGLPIAVAEDTPLVIDVWSNDSAGADGVDLATGVVEASTSNPQKGSVTYNGDGTFTYTPNAGAEGADSFQYTVTDNDGDEVVVAATVYVDIGPDTVPITGTSAATVDDDGVAGGIGDNATGDWVDTNADLDNDESTFSGSLTAIFGGDIPGDVNFADMPATGTVGTENVAYAWVDGTSTLTATVDGGARDGLELFTVEVTDRLTGDYTVTLKANVMHETLDGLAGDNTENDASASLTYTATDSDGSSTPGTLNITFDDDIPVAIAPVAIGENEIINSAGESVTGKGLDVDSIIDNNIGADQEGDLVFTATDGTDSEMTSAGAPIYYYVAADGHTLWGSTTLPASWDVNSPSGLVFTLSLNLGATDTYDFALHQGIDGGSGVFSSGDLGYNFLGGNNPFAYFDNTSGDAPDILLTPMAGTPPVSSGTINGSANNIGVNAGQSVGADEAVRVDFVQGIAGDPARSDTGGYYELVANQDHTFTGHQDVNGAEAVFDKISSPSTITVKAFDDANGNNTVGDGVQDTITTVIISHGTESAIVNSDGTVIVNGNSYTVSFGPAGVATIAGVVSLTTIGVATADGLNSIEYHWAGGGAFKVSGFGAISFEPGVEIDLAFDLAISDADGDTLPLADAINIHLEADNPLASPVARAAAPAADEAEQDPVIQLATEDADTLVATDGADVFAWSLADNDAQGDLVTGFDPAADTIDLRDLLVGEELEGADLTSYLDVSFDGANTVIRVSSEGDFDQASPDIGTPNQVITVEGVDLVGDQSELSSIIQNMLNEGQLSVD